MSKQKFIRLFFLFLSFGFLFAILHIGKAYSNLNSYTIEYGYSVNLFSPNEGVFYLVYGFCAFMGTLFLTMAFQDLIYSKWVKIDWSGIDFLRLTLFLTISTVLVTYLIRILVIQDAPMTDDEHAYLFSARMIQSFKLYWADFPKELTPFLHNQFLVIKNFIFTQYYPGFPGILALGATLGSVNLVNPILAGLGILTTFFLVRKVSSSPIIAFLAALLLSLSPSYLFTSAMLMPHTASLVLGSLFILMVIKSNRETSSIFAALAGLVWGLLLFTRPLTAFIFGIIGAIISIGYIKNLRQRIKPVITLAGIALIFCAFFLMYNKMLTGDFFKTTYTEFAEFSNKIFFNSFSFQQILNGKWSELLVFPFLRMNYWTFGWSISFLFVFFCPPGYLRKLGLGVVLGLWLAHMPWPNVGVNLTGAAHYMEVLPFLAMLSALALHTLYKKKNTFIAGSALSFTIFSILIALTIFSPWAARNLSNLASTNLAPYQVEAQVKKPAIIFSSIFLPTHQGVIQRTSTWTYYRKNNHPDLSDDILWLNDLKEKNINAMKLFPDRHAYRLRFNYDPASGTGFLFSLEDISSSEMNKGIETGLNPMSTSKQ